MEGTHVKYATATFWEGLAERAISTFSQSLVGAFGVGTSIFAGPTTSGRMDAYTPRHSTGQTGLAG